jgi:hypothetical protein
MIEREPPVLLALPMAPAAIGHRLRGRRERTVAMATAASMGSSCVRAAPPAPGIRRWSGCSMVFRQATRCVD